MSWKSQDWIEHASFGLGRVSESRGDRLDIDFVNSGAKTILMTTLLKRPGTRGANDETPPLLCLSSNPDP
jgi:hypothetical protein